MNKSYVSGKGEFIFWVLNAVFLAFAFAVMYLTQNGLLFFILLVLSNIVSLIHFVYFTRSYERRN